MSHLWAEHHQSETQAWLPANGLPVCPPALESAATMLTSEALSSDSQESRRDQTGKVAHLPLLTKANAPCVSLGSNESPPSYSCESLGPWSHID